MVDRLRAFLAHKRPLHQLRFISHPPQQNCHQRRLRVAVSLALVQKLQRKLLGQFI